MTDNPGTWLLHCHVNKHFSSGMQVCPIKPARCATVSMPAETVHLTQYLDVRMRSSVGVTCWLQALVTLTGSQPTPFTRAGVERTYYVQVDCCPRQHMLWRFWLSPKASLVCSMKYT